MADTAGIVLLIAGVLLIIAEVAVPGFGVMGILGLGAVIGAIILYATSITQAVILITVAIAVVAALYIVSAMLFSKRSRFVLKDEEKPEEGYVAARVDKTIVGKRGVAETDLHPSGAVRIENVRYSVVTGGEYIQKGERVRITDVTGNNIKVEKED